MRPLFILVFLSSAVLPACTHRPAFLPAAPTVGAQPVQYGASIYDMTTSAGDWGEIKVWTRGIQEREAGEQGIPAVRIRPVVHVGFDIKNESNQTMKLRLAETQLELHLLDNESITFFGPALTKDKLTVGRGKNQTMNLLFPLANDFPTRNVIAYKVHWTVRAKGKNYVQTTLFTRNTNAPQAAAFGPYQPYNNPENTRIEDWSFLTPLGVRFGTVTDRL